MVIPGSPVPQEVSDELRRVVERWHQMPLDHALSSVPGLRAVVEALAGEPVADLGPAVLMDQLTVMVHDTCCDAVESGRTQGWPGQLTGQLAGLRRSLL